MTQINLKKTSFNDGLLSGSRGNYMVIVTPEKCFGGFKETCQVAVASTSYDKNGKWSNTTYEFETATNVAVIEYHANLHGKLFEEYSTIDQLVGAFIKVSGLMVDADSLIEILRDRHPKSIGRVEQKEKELEQVHSTVDDVREFSFGCPTNAQIRDGWWESPKSSPRDDCKFRLKDPEEGWRLDNVDSDKAKILDVSTSPGMHGGFVHIEYVKK